MTVRPVPWWPCGPMFVARSRPSLVAVREAVRACSNHLHDLDARCPPHAATRSPIARLSAHPMNLTTASYRLYAPTWAARSAPQSGHPLVPASACQALTITPTPCRRPRRRSRLPERLPRRPRPVVLDELDGPGRKTGSCSVAPTRQVLVSAADAGRLAPRTSRPHVAESGSSLRAGKPLARRLRYDPQPLRPRLGDGRNYATRACWRIREGRCPLGVAEPFGPARIAVRCPPDRRRPRPFELRTFVAALDTRSAGFGGCFVISAILL